MVCWIKDSDCKGALIFLYCINHRLRLNTKHSKPDLLINHFKKRLTKLIKRGWIPCNISKDKKLLYKKIYIKKQKNKHSKKTKKLLTRKEFIDKTIYKLNSIIIVDKLMLKYSKINKQIFDLLTQISGKQNITIVRDHNKLIQNLHIKYDITVLLYVKKIFDANLPLSIKNVYSNNITTFIHRIKNKTVNNKFKTPRLEIKKKILKSIFQEPF